MPKHIHIAGFARGGTTLMRNLFLAFEDVWVHPADIHYLDFKNHVGSLEPDQNYGTIVTKAPGMGGALPALLDDALVLVIIRDPRDAATSKKETSDSTDPFMFADPWSCIGRNIKEYNQLPIPSAGLLEIYYEELVNLPDKLQAVIAKFFGLTIKVPFSQAYTLFPEPDVFNGNHQLNGIRPPDNASVGRWRDPEWADYLERLYEDGGNVLRAFLQQHNYPLR